MLPDIIRRGRTPTVGITVSQATISLRITAIGDNEQQCRVLIEPTLQTIHQCLGDLVFGEGDDELQHAVVQLLSQRRQTLATAEWGPGGLLAHWLSQADPQCQCYLGGKVLRTGAQPAPHADFVCAAASDIRSAYQADYGLAIGPFPPGNAEPEAQYVTLAVASDRAAQHQSVRFTGHPDILQARCTKQGLNLLRLWLLKPAASDRQRSNPAP
jgi:nicotinamide-nucleotide amidase